MATKSPKTTEKTVKPKARAATRPSENQPPRRSGGVTKNDVKKKRPQHVANLINDTFWLLGLLVTVYAALSLASFTMDDPAWSRSVPPSDEVHNLGGLFGAYLADIGYYLFGLSFWWLIAAAAVLLYKNFRPLHTPERKPYNHTIAAAALAVLLLCSPILEVFSFQNRLDDSLPVGAGGLIGSFSAKGLSWLLGTSGSLLIMLVVLLLALSLLAQVSWLDILEKTGAKLEWFWLKLNRKEDKYIRDLPDAKTTRRMVREAKNITAEPVEQIEKKSVV